jgi:hypothetical protein
MKRILSTTIQLALSLIMLLGLTAVASAATPPDLLNYQGVLRDSTDNPENGDFDMIFRFYDAATVGNEILVDEHLASGTGAVGVTGGLFNVSLGGGLVTDGSGPKTYTTLTDMFRNYGEVWVEITIESDPAMTPRIRVTSAAYALHAASAATLDGMGTANFLARDASDTSTASVIGDLYTFTNTNSTSGSAALHAELAPAVVGTGEYYGGRGTASVGDDGSNPDDTINSGLYGVASGSSAVGGDMTRNFGVFGKADGSGANASSYNYGVRGEAEGGTLNLGGFFKGTEYGTYNRVEESLNTNLYGAYNHVTNENPSGGAYFYGSFHRAEATAPGNDLSFFGLHSWATAAADSTGTHWGVYGEADGGDGDHYGVYGKADSTGSGSHYGVYGAASPFSAGTGTHYGVYGTANNGATNYAGYFESWDSSPSGTVYGGYNKAQATGASNSMVVYGLRGIATGSGTSTGNHYGIYANATTPTSGGTHYGVYGSASGGSTNWGIYTPQRAAVGENLYVGHLSSSDNDYVYFDAGAENLWWSNSSSWFVLSDDLTPNSSNSQTIGSSSYYWYRMYAGTYFGKNTSIFAFDDYPDLDLLDAMEMVSHQDPVTGRTGLIFDPATIPAMIKGDPAVDGPGADQHVDLMKAIGFAFGSLRQMRAETRGRDTALREELDLKTPDDETGKQEMDGNLQIVLDKNADNEARFSVFRDGKDGLEEEVFRVDEDGNLYLRGSLRPSSLDLAEYHPVAEPVEPGDVLVADRKVPGRLLRSAFADDRAVVGVVSTAPGIELGRSIQRVAPLEPDLAAIVEEARDLGDGELEELAWKELERRFQETHAAIALAGTVLCKVDADHGAIEIGDLLVTSPTPGHAMRSDDPTPGTVIGKALEALPEGTGLIRVLAMLR